MELEDQIKYGHLLLYERECRTCGVTKNLLEGFYRIRKTRGITASSFSYECKECTIKRITNKRKQLQEKDIKWHYPDW
jgi:hypothetical protein